MPKTVGNIFVKHSTNFCSFANELRHDAVGDIVGGEMLESCDGLCPPLKVVKV